MDGKNFPFLAAKGDGTLISVHVQPKASKNEFCGIFQDRLKVRVCAPPVEGEANKQCIILIAQVLGISKSEISLARGAQSRQKTFLVAKPMDFVRDQLEKAGVAA